MEGPCEASLSLSHTHIHPHTHAGHSLGGLLGGRLVFELQISVLWLGLLETERQMVRHKPRIPETKTRCFSSKALAPVALFILGPDQCNQSFSSTAQLDRSGSVCCTQNLLKLFLICSFLLTCIFPCLISSVNVTHQVGAVLDLAGLDALGHSQVDELVLGFCLHQAGALLSHHLDVFGDVDVAVQTWRGDGKTVTHRLEGKSKRNEKVCLF